MTDSPVMVENGDQRAPASVKVAAVQAEPVWLDLQGTVNKTCQLITEAASNGAKLVAFPECWIPGYPCWIWLRSIDFELMPQYLKNSLKVDSAEMQQICSCAAENNIAVVLGYSENLNNSLYIGQATITAAGELAMTRRKLKATHLERTVFGDANASSLKNVSSLKLDSNLVAKVGALSCWEHIQPLLKYNTYLQGEEIHVSAWPPLDPFNGGLYGMSAEGCKCLSQTYAMESAAFVIHSTAVVSEAGIERMKLAGAMMWSKPGGGASCIVAPDGRLLTEPMPPTEQGLVYADLELDAALRSKCFVDACGHYSRPDLLWLGVDEREKSHKVAVTEGS